MAGGYVGYSRSVRSQVAINSYEVPFSMISKELIDEFLEVQEGCFLKEDLEFLKKVSSSKWKYVAKEKINPSSWHHTSSFYNKTNHYSLEKISLEILAIRESLDADYLAYKNYKKTNSASSNIRFGVVCVQVWGGTRNNPRIIGHEQAAGIIIGDWLFFRNNHSLSGRVEKYKISAKKVDWLRAYTSYKELIITNPKYINTEEVFQSLIAEKVK